MTSTIIPSKAVSEYPHTAFISEVEGRIWLVSPKFGCKRTGVLIAGDTSDDWPLGSICPWDRDVPHSGEKVLTAPITVEFRP